MQRVAYWLTPLIAIGVALFITIFLVQINRSEPIPTLQPAPINPDYVTKALPKKRWLDTLAASERHGYFYPVNEIFIELDLNQKAVTEQIYRLSAKLDDPYQLFCLKQELKQHRLRYFLKKEKHGIDLLIYSKEQQKMKALEKRLKTYQISAKITPYKEDKRWISTK